MSDRTKYLLHRAELAMGSGLRFLEEIEFQRRRGWLLSVNVSDIQRRAAKEAASLIWC